MKRDIVKTMERGQITIPAKIRSVLGIVPQTLLWVSVSDDGKILMELVESDKKLNLKKHMEKLASSKKVYWTKDDDRGIKQIKKNTADRLSKQYE